MRAFDEHLGSRLASDKTDKGITVWFEMDVETIVKNDRRGLTVSYKWAYRRLRSSSFCHRSQSLYCESRTKNTCAKLRSNGSIIVDDYFQTQNQVSLL